MLYNAFKNISDTESPTSSPGLSVEQRDTMLGGDIAVAFFVVGGTASLVIGYLTDRVQSRIRLFAYVVTESALACNY